MWTLQLPNSLIIWGLEVFRVSQLVKSTFAFQNLHLFSKIDCVEQIVAIFIKIMRREEHLTDTLP